MQYFFVCDHSCEAYSFSPDIDAYGIFNVRTNLGASNPNGNIGLSLQNNDCLVGHTVALATRQHSRLLDKPCTLFREGDDRASFDY